MQGVTGSVCLNSWVAGNDLSFKSLKMVARRLSGGGHRYYSRLEAIATSNKKLLVNVPNHIKPPCHPDPQDFSHGFGTVAVVMHGRQWHWLRYTHQPS